jgi:hypothetical protein
VPNLNFMKMIGEVYKRLESQKVIPKAACLDKNN